MTLQERLEDKGFVLDAEEFDGVVTYDGFDDAIIGVSDDFNAIYDYDKMVLCLMLHEDMDEEEAMEHIDYNILGFKISCEKAPIIIYRL